MGGIDFVLFIPGFDLLQSRADRLTSGEGDMGVLAAPDEQGLGPQFVHARETIVRFPGPERPRMDIGRIETRRRRDRRIKRGAVSQVTTQAHAHRGEPPVAGRRSEPELQGRAWRPRRNRQWS